MRSARRRKADAVVALAVLAAATVLAVDAWHALSGDPAVDCDGDAFPTRDWRDALVSVDEPAMRLLARNVEHCGLVDGRTRDEVRALLGPRHRERGASWRYEIGEQGGFLPDGVYLVVTFARGRATGAATRP